MELEAEYASATALQAKLTQKTSFLVSDIRKVGRSVSLPSVSQARESESKALTLGKQLSAAREYVLELNKSQYEGWVLGDGDREGILTQEGARPDGG